jgi:hypothetical protein
MRRTRVGKGIAGLGRLAGLLAAMWLLAGCGNAAPAPAGALPAPGTVRKVATSRVVVVVMENKEASDVLGNSEAPYLNRLVRHGGLATRSYGVRHPSLPNYLALTSGSTHGITSDCTDCRVRGRSIVDQLEAAHLRWRAYMEDLPQSCFAGASSGGYAKKHDPFMYYDAVALQPSRCRNVVSFGRLARDLRRGALPAYAFVSPNLCHDTHDCGIAEGDRFLSRLVPSLLRSLGPHGYLVLTYDEGSSDAGCCGGADGGRIATVVAGPDVRAGARSGRPVDHYGVLATIERSLGLPRLGAAKDKSHGSLRALFRRHRAIR